MYKRGSAILDLRIFLFCVACSN